MKRWQSLSKKLRRKSGETLTETLCAVLVAGIAIAVLMGMVEASSRLEHRAAQTAARLYAAVSLAEEAKAETAEAPVGQVMITFKQDGTPVATDSVQYDVTFYGDKEQAVSYRIKKEAAGS